MVGGLQLGNVWLGVQPALGLEGDPMRLLFERDLTPHPQYAAFYLWLQRGLAADAVCHLGAPPPAPPRASAPAAQHAATLVQEKRAKCLEGQFATTLVRKKRLNSGELCLPQPWLERSA